MKKKFMWKKEKVKNIIFLIIRLIVVGLIVMSIVGLFTEQNDENRSRLIFVALQALLLLGATFVPLILEHTWKINIPSTMEIIFIAFCTCALLLGEIGDYYIKYSWWDSLLHTLSGSLIACVGFVILNYFNQSENYSLKMNPLFCAIFVFCFSVTIGGLWEVVEWFADEINGTNMQRYQDNITGAGFIGRAALRDTMKDIMLDMIGAVVIAIIGFVDLKIDKGFVRKIKVEKIKPIEEPIE